MINDEQLNRFIESEEVAHIIEATSLVFKDNIMNTQPNDIEGRETAYHMYHSLNAMVTIMNQLRNEIVNKSIELDNTQI